MRARLLRPVLSCAGLALVAGGLAPLAGAASAGAATAPAQVAGTAIAATPGPGRALAPTTRFFIRPPDKGAIQQGLQLLRSGDLKDAARLAKMEATPRRYGSTGAPPRK